MAQTQDSSPSRLRPIVIAALAVALVAGWILDLVPLPWLLAGLVAAVIAIAGCALSCRVSSRIRRLTALARDLATGRTDVEFDRDLLDSPDEIGETARAFRNLSDQLGSTIRRLSESEDRFRTMVETASDWIWETDASGAYTYASPRVRELLGYEPHEVVGRTPFDLMPPSEAERVRARFEEAVAARGPILGLVNVGIHRDGHEVVLETSGMPILDGDGELRGFRGIDRDITERRRAEEALQASRAMLQLVMDNIPQFIFWKDRDSVYLGCNRNLARVAGAEKPEDIIGKTDHDLAWKPEEAEFFRECDRRVMESDRPEYHILERQQQADGKQAWLDTNKIPLHDAAGNVVGILGTYEDITERREAAEAARRSRLNLQTLFDTLDDFLLVLTPGGRILQANPVVETRLGYSADRLRELHVRDLHPEDRHPEISAMIAFAASGHASLCSIPLVTRSGRRIPVETKLVHGHWDGEDALYAISRDITERVRAMEELRRIHEDLEEKA